MGLPTSTSFSFCSWYTKSYVPNKWRYVVLDWFFVRFSTGPNTDTDGLVMERTAFKTDFAFTLPLIVFMALNKISAAPHVRSEFEVSAAPCEYFLICAT